MNEICKAFVKGGIQGMIAANVFIAGTLMLVAGTGFIIGKK